jgi:hypothetical protein
LKLPKIPKAVVKAFNVTKSLVTQAQKLAAMAETAAANSLIFAHTAVASQTVTLIVKRGTAVIFSQKISPLGPV